MDTTNIRGKGINVIKKDISMVENEYIRHNPEVIAKTIMEFICNDLKFKNKQSEQQFVFLNSKIKDKNKEERQVKKIEKKEEQKQKVNEPKNKTNRFKRKSKFESKYKDRINSIKSTATKREKNLKMYEKAEQLQREEKEKEKFLNDTYNKQ